MLVEQALDRRSEPLMLFFRDDDAGWDMPALDLLLDLFAENVCPLDLATIPCALDEVAARRLGDWRTAHPGVGIHQHGYAHTNHEHAGARKCEFGPARPIAAQRRDIAAGRERLASLLGHTDPIFTPPWNRCEPETIAGLTQLGFAAYSGDRRSGSGAGLALIPVALDWDRLRREQRLEQAIAEAIATARTPLGVMFHHATLDDPARSRIREFLGLLSVHESVRCVSMRSLIPEPPRCAD